MTEAIANTPPAPPVRGLAAVVRLARDIKLAHSVFALPFALFAAMLAADEAGLLGAGDAGPDLSGLAGRLALVVVAMVAARTWAMLANRIADAQLDARNPRTAGRAVASGAVTRGTAIGAAAVSAAVFAATCAGFHLFFANPWPLLLALPVLAWIGAYPLFKRFTSLCHVWLGASLALSPVAAALAVHPPAALLAPIWLLAGMVMLWVAGFDVLYAMQDVEVDRRDGLHSLPSRLGARRALLLARAMHVGAALFLAATGVVDPRLGVLFAIAVAGAAGLLAWEHAVIARHGVARITLAFFTLNGIVSCVVGTLGIADVLV